MIAELAERHAPEIGPLTATEGEPALAGCGVLEAAELVQPLTTEGHGIPDPSHADDDRTSGEEHQTEPPAASGPRHGNGA